MKRASMPGGPATVSGAVRFGHMLGVQQPPDEAAEMVAVQVRDEDRADGVRVEAQPVEADHGGGAAVDQEAVAVPVVDMVAGLQIGRPSRRHRRIRRRSASWRDRPTRCASGMPAPQALALGRAETSPYQRSTFFSSGGSVMRAGRMKSTATSAVMSATE